MAISQIVLILLAIAAMSVLALSNRNRARRLLITIIAMLAVYFIAIGVVAFCMR